MTSRAVFSAQQTPATPYFPPLCSDAAYSRLNEDDGEPPAHTLIPPPVTTRAWRRSSLSGIDLDELRDQSTYFLCAIQGFVRSNAGLLLIMLAQLFFACMNVSVKLLNSLDPPVPALEVRLIHTCYCFPF